MTKGSQKATSEKKECSSCTKFKSPKIDFYMSNSKYHSDQRFPVCKTCLAKDISIDHIESVKKVLLELNRPFIANLWQSTLIEAENKNSHPFGLYLKNCQISYKELTWLDSDAEIKDSSKAVESQETVVTFSSTPIVTTDNDKKNELDVLRMLGYDPFEGEPASDRRHLFNKLVDFLDESTLEDNFKLPTVIEIVKSFNQIDKINSAISNITSDTKTVSENVGRITSLVNAKEKMLKSVLALAKDNGISVNHNNNKSKGAGTLSGIIKQLQEKGVETADINVYDVETSEGMRQVADISNRSILDQLMLNENDYAEMIKDQKELIDNLNSRVLDMEEENRLLKIKLKQYEEL